MHTNHHENNRRILFASIPGDGHFNPLTGLAKHLQCLGYDVRWYTGAHYAPKLRKLGIPHYPFRRAKEINSENMDELFPERTTISNKLKKLNFDLLHLFVDRGPEFYEDLRDIRREFDFELLVADVAFTAIPFVKDLMQIPVFTIGVVPLVQTSSDLPPAGLGLEPARGLAGKLRDALLRFAAKHLLFRKAQKAYNDHLLEYGAAITNEFIFDMAISKSTLYLQSGTPGFEYTRRDLRSNIRFLGPLLPYSSGIRKSIGWYDVRLQKYRQVVLVTQGTVEKDVAKLIVPTLEAFRNSDRLVIVTTGGSQTRELRSAYPDDNFIIEDFIPFEDVMPYVDVYITNGGYGGVMLGIENRLPMVVAGVHEGKNEICARVGYFKLGVNLKTETPAPDQIRLATEEVLKNALYQSRVDELAREFGKYNAADNFAQYVAMALGSQAGGRRQMAA